MLWLWEKINEEKQTEDTLTKRKVRSCKNHASPLQFAPGLEQGNAWIKTKKTDNIAHLLSHADNDHFNDNKGAQNVNGMRYSGGMNSEST